MEITVDNIEYENGEQITGIISGRLMPAYYFPTSVPHVLHVEPKGQTPEGRTVWHYILESSGEVIFEGEDLQTSAYSPISPAEAAKSLLSFLTLRPGDIDAEYFDNYTEEQISWRDEHAEELSLYTID